MAKITFSIIIFVFLFGNSNNCFSQVYSPQRTCLIKVFKSQIGVKEATGNNDGPAVEMYLKTVGLGKGYPWCAAFIKWSLLEVKAPGAQTINGMALSTDRPDRYVYFKGKYFGKTLLPGDVGTLYYSSLKRIGHVFFYNGSAGAGSIYTVEGNTNSQNSRDGDGVYLRIRSLSSVHSINRWVQ